MEAPCKYLRKVQKVLSGPELLAHDKAVTVRKVVPGEAGLGFIGNNNKGVGVWLVS